METNHEDNRRKLRDLIKGIKFAMLTTVDAKGALRSRPMTTLEADEGGDLWFFTAADEPKVEDIRREEQVNVAYADPGDNRYVSVSGRARLVRDRAKIKELWRPIYKAFFKEGLEDPRLALLRVTAHEAEYWDSPSNFVTQTIRMVQTLLTGDESHMGDNAKLKL